MDNQFHLIDIDELTQSGNSVHRVTTGISGDKLDLATENTTVGINVIGCHLHTFQTGLANEAFRTGERGDKPDLDW
jgi:hypothetical protein